MTHTAGLERLMGVKLPGSDRWLGPGGRNMWPKTGAGEKVAGHRQLGPGISQKLECEAINLAAGRTKH